MKRSGLVALRMQSVWLALAALAMSSGLTGCLVAGYSSGGGWFVWPGSVGLLVVLLLLFLILRRR